LPEQTGAHIGGGTEGKEDYPPPFLSVEQSSAASPRGEKEGRRYTGMNAGERKRVKKKNIVLRIV